MRIDYDLASTQLFLEHVGHCRFSAFVDHRDRKSKVLIEMVGRFAVGLFAAIGAYDLAANSLPSVVRIIIGGTLLTIISSLVGSILLKKFLPSHKECHPILPASPGWESDDLKANELVQPPSDRVPSTKSIPLTQTFAHLSDVGDLGILKAEDPNVTPLYRREIKKTNLYRGTPYSDYPAYPRPPVSKVRRNLMDVFNELTPMKERTNDEKLDLLEWEDLSGE